MEGGRVRRDGGREEGREGRGRQREGEVKEAVLSELGEGAE